MSVSDFIFASQVFASLGLVLVVCGWSIGMLVIRPSKGQLDLRSSKPSARAALVCILSGAFSLAIGLLLILAVGLWWGFAIVFATLTPGELALLSLVVGVAPLLVTAFAKVVCVVLGGSVDASGARNCFLFGKDISALIHTLFMAYWLVYITAGFAVVGLLGSGIWALVR